MDGLSAAANVVAVVQLTGSLVKICGGYIQEVKDARDDIIALQRSIATLQSVLYDLQGVLHSLGDKALPSSSRVASNITECLSDLRALDVKIDPGKGRNLMRRVGFRALKWPLKRSEVDAVVQNLDRHKSSFTLSLQVDQTTLMTEIRQHTEQANELVDLDNLSFARGAEYNSYLDQYEGECLPGTRTKILEQVEEWAVSAHGKQIFWLNGMAGTGKSTISRTVAKSLKDSKLLGASFFFKRGEGDRGNAAKVFPTIARQLILRFPGLITGVRKAVREDPDIASKSLQEQFDKLLLQPLLDLDHEQLQQQPDLAVIVLDALDECAHEQNIRNIIGLLPLLQRTTAFRLRIFLTSRPELAIRLGFARIENQDYQNISLHEVEEKVTEHDISLFLNHQFATMRQERNFSQDWPGDDIIQSLVDMSVPLFISAATVCRYIENPIWDPRARLAELLTDQARYAKKMDKTYLPILSRLINDHDCDASEQEQLLHEFQGTVGIMILLVVPLSINTLSRLAGTMADIISNRLDSFQSVLDVSKDRDRPVRMLHSSFRDFLLSTDSQFHVDEAEKHSEIAALCLRTMRAHLKRNICNLEGPGTHREEVDTQSICQCFPPELQYACRYWIHHFQQSKATRSEIEEVSVFLKGSFLYWVEAMSLLGFISEVVGMLNLLQAVISGQSYPALSGLLYDAMRFILKNRQIADNAPLQIYCSGLVFAPRTAVIRQLFTAELPSWIYQLPQVDERWNSELQALEGHTRRVEAAAFSQDGRLLVSGSSDKTVRLWDTLTGSLQQNLEGHSGIVRSVTFSSNNRLLASSSDDKTVRIWNTETGALHDVLKGHAAAIPMAVISLDSSLLASASLDKTIKIWNISTGALQRTLMGHLGPVWSIAFSSDSQLLVSGSDDKTVQIWDTVTGTVQRTLEGHSGPVRSVTLSSNNLLLASGSQDNTARLWDTATGTLQHILEGHSNWVSAVSFSPSGNLLASGSYDRTIRLWDTATGTLQHTLEDHSGGIRSVEFSPNGRLIGFTPSDETVRLWEITACSPQRTPDGHSGWVWSVEFSPDGRLLASSGRDKTVRLWDTTTSTLKQTFTGHSRSVRSVSFSPDGQLLASGSHDKTVIIWNAVTGNLQQTLEGHTAWVRLVVFSPNNQLLASTSYDRTVRLWDTATGALKQTWAFNKAIIQLTFSLDGSCMNTELGPLSVQTSSHNPVSYQPHVDQAISIQQAQWIILNGKKVLWLPTEVRPSCWTVKGNMLALGHASGRISFIGFHI